MRPEFTEREFEFCFNSEFIRKNRTAIIGLPRIPSQRVEALLGYDIEFRLRNAAVSYSLFLQHKVSNFVTHRRGSNWPIYDFYRGSYFYFYLDKSRNYRQHNLLYNLSMLGEQVYYTAPIFGYRHIFTQHFINEVVINNTIFIDPIIIGMITNMDTHKISYNPDVSRMAFHSEFREIDKPIDYELMTKKLKRVKFDETYISNLLSALESGLEKIAHADMNLHKDYFQLPNLTKCIHLLQNYYKLRWIIF